MIDNQQYSNYKKADSIAQHNTRKYSTRLVASYTILFILNYRSSSGTFCNYNCLLLDYKVN